MVISDLLSGAKSFHKIYNQSIQTAASRHGLSLMDGDVILFLYNNPDYDTAKDISTFRMLAKSGGIRFRGVTDRPGILRRP